jgi:hypothetical protein
MMIRTSGRLVPMMSLRERFGILGRLDAGGRQQRQRFFENAALGQGDGDAVARLCLGRGWRGILAYGAAGSRRLTVAPSAVSFCSMRS